MGRKPQEAKKNAINAINQDAANENASEKQDNITSCKRVNKYIQHLERIVAIPGTQMLLKVKSYRCSVPGHDPIEVETRKGANEWVAAHREPKAARAKKGSKGAIARMESAIKSLDKASGAMGDAASRKGLSAEQVKDMLWVKEEVRKLSEEVKRYVAQVNPS